MLYFATEIKRNDLVLVDIFKIVKLKKFLGIFDFLRCNFINPPTADLSYSFLTALTNLMLAQAQESRLELKMLGGFEIELGKCVNIAQASMKVSEKIDKLCICFLSRY